MKEFYFLIDGEMTLVTSDSKEEAFEELKYAHPDSTIFFNREIIHYIP